MSQSTDGILAYGYDLGGPEEKWRVKEADEWGSLDDNRPPWLPDPENDEDDYDLPTIIMDYLLEQNGEDLKWLDSNSKARDKAVSKLSVEIVTYGSDSYPQYILALSPVFEAARGHVTDILDEIEKPENELPDDPETVLAKALGYLGITPLQEKPGLLLCSYADGMF